MHYLLKFGYDGSMFSGYQRGNGDHSVEDSILKVMARYGISNGFSSAARTDRGVSAAGNVIFLRSEMDIKKVIGILNSQLRNIIFHSYALVGSDFRVRFSSRKHYRYNLFDEGIDRDKFARSIGMFAGTHDFSSFSRRDSRNPVRTVDEVSVRDRGDYLEVNVFGPNFVWNQIRSMIGFARHCASIEGELHDPFTTAKKRWSLAEPEPLTLMDIEYKNVEFSRHLGRKTVGIWKRSVRDLKMHTSVISNIIENASQNTSDKEPD